MLRRPKYPFLENGGADRPPGRMESVNRKIGRPMRPECRADQNTPFWKTGRGERGKHVLLGRSGIVSVRKKASFWTVLANLQPAKDPSLKIREFPEFSSIFGEFSRLRSNFSRLRPCPGYPKYGWGFAIYSSIPIHFAPFSGEFLAAGNSTYP